MISPSPIDSANWTQNDFDRFFMNRAIEVARETDDPKYKINNNAAVGAVIVKARLIVSESANRLPSALRKKINFTGASDPNRYVYIEHAERASIFEALAKRADIDAGTMYCTRFPCIDCARAIVFVGLSRLVVEKGFSGEGEWVDSQRRALKMLRAADVTVRYFSVDD